MTATFPLAVSRSAYAGCAALGVVAMLANFAPSPLYGAYKAEWHMSDTAVAMVFSAYSLGTMVVLTMFGGLSDIWGRRRVLRLCCCGLAVSLVIMMVAWHPAALLTGRLLQGLSTGVMTATIAATLMEFHPRGEISAGARINTLTFSAGSAFGPLLAGTLATLAPWPLRLPYATILVMLALCLLVVSALPREPLSPSSATRTIRPLRVPAAIRRPFLVACSAILLPNCGMGVFGAFAGHLSSSVGRHGASDAGLIVFGALATMAAAQVVFLRVVPRAAILSGAALTCMGWSCIVLAVYLGSALVLSVGVLTAGTAAGLGFLGSATLIGQVSPSAQRAEVYSAYLMSAFVGMAGSAMLAGISLHFLDLETLVLALTGAMWMGGFALALAIRRGPSHYSSSTAVAHD